jgi:hypothetical protein
LDINVHQCDSLGVYASAVNFESGEWLIPEETAKTAKPHIVYMSTQVATMFRELKTLAGDSKFVLPGRSVGAVSKRLPARDSTERWALGASSRCVAGCTGRKLLSRSIAIEGTAPRTGMESASPPGQNRHGIHVLMSARFSFIIGMVCRSPVSARGMPFWCGRRNAVS